MTDFIPNGFWGLPKCIWFLASRTNPPIWEPASIDPAEWSVWSNLIINHDATWIEDRVRYIYFSRKEPQPIQSVERVSSYHAAEAHLRRALYSGAVVAYFVSGAPEAHGSIQHVLKEGWGTDAGQEILWRGRASLEGEPTERVLFLDGFSYRQHFFEHQAAQDGGPTAPASSEGKAPQARRGRPPAYDWAKARAKAFEHLEYHGMPDPNDADLPSQAALERLIAEFLTTAERSPSESQVREYVGKWIAEFAKGLNPRG